MIKRIGKRTLALENRPYLLGHAAAVGKKEGEGPLGERFDYVAKNDRMGQRSWELAESELQKTAIRLALRKATLPERSLDLILAGDLLNQCIGSFLASMHANVPYLGQYGACSTMAQGSCARRLSGRERRGRPACLRQHPRISARQSGSTVFRLPTAGSVRQPHNGRLLRQARQCSAVNRCRTARSRAMCA